MPSDRSVIIVVPVASENNVSKTLAAFWGDDPPGTDEFSAAFSETGVDPATHFGLHIWQDAGQSIQMSAMPTGSGTVPTPLAAPIGDYGITTQNAKDACATIVRVSVMTGDGIVPNEHLDTVLAGIGLQRIDPPDVH